MDAPHGSHPSGHISPSLHTAEVLPDHLMCAVLPGCPKYPSTVMREQPEPPSALPGSRGAPSPPPAWATPPSWGLLGGFCPCAHPKSGACLVRLELENRGQMVDHQLQQPEEQGYFRFEGFPLCNGTDAARGRRWVLLALGLLIMRDLFGFFFFFVS